MFNQSNRFRNYARPMFAKTRNNVVTEKTWDAEQVFAAAVAAQEINGEYCKFPQHDAETGKLTKSPNKILMRSLLDNGQQFTPEQIEQGERVRRHYQGLLFQQVAGDLKDFLATALKVATRETFTNRDQLELSVAAALPSCYVRDIKRLAAEEERKELSKNSAPYGSPGQRIRGEFEIVQCNWSQKWNSWTVNAVMDNNLFFFFMGSRLDQGSKVNLAATVKNYRDGNVTQLNRVKVVK